MKLEGLSMREKLFLCRFASAASARRLHLLALRVDPGDEPLRRLFEDLAGVEDKRQERIASLEAGAGLAAEPCFDQAELQGIAGRFLPSLSISTGGGSIDRESGTYLVECLQRESASLYRTLAEHATDDESRTFFLSSLKEEETHLEFMRHVVL